MFRIVLLVIAVLIVLGIFVGPRPDLQLHREADPATPGNVRVTEAYPGGTFPHRYLETEAEWRENVAAWCAGQKSLADRRQQMLIDRAWKALDRKDQPPDTVSGNGDAPAQPESRQLKLEDVGNGNLGLKEMEKADRLNYEAHCLRQGE